MSTSSILNAALLASMLMLALLVSTGRTAAESQYPQSSPRETGTTASGQKTVEGCLQDGNGNYTLTSATGVTYQLQGDTAVLSKHVGHEVRITGSSSGVGASSAVMGPDGGTSAGGSEHTLMVDSVKHIAKTCGSESKSAR
jgi:hypothetical protein